MSGRRVDWRAVRCDAVVGPLAPQSDPPQPGGGRIGANPVDFDLLAKCLNLTESGLPERVRHWRRRHCNPPPSVDTAVGDSPAGDHAAGGLAPNGAGVREVAVDRQPPPTWAARVVLTKQGNRTVKGTIHRKQAPLPQRRGEQTALLDLVDCDDLRLHKDGQQLRVQRVNSCPPANTKHGC